MAETTVLNWSGGYSDLKLNSQGPKVRDLRTLLAGAGIDMTAYPEPEDPDIFDEGLEEALCEYQRIFMDMDKDSPSYGILDDSTLNALLNSVEVSGDLSNYDGTADTDTDLPSGGDESIPESDPHYNAFFNTDNEKVFRKNGTDIKIVLGQSSHIVKTIHNVFMRSSGVEFDTSGNPISETYEFIGQDITESDEENDGKKYKV